MAVSSGVVLLNSYVSGAGKVMRLSVSCSLGISIHTPAEYEGDSASSMLPVVGATVSLLAQIVTSVSSKAMVAHSGHDADEQPTNISDNASAIINFMFVPQVVDKKEAPLGTYFHY